MGEDEGGWRAQQGWIPGQLEMGTGCGGGPRWTCLTNHSVLGAEGFLDGNRTLGSIGRVQDLQRKEGVVVGRGSVEGKMQAGDKGCRLDLSSYSSLLVGSLESERVQGLRPAGFGSVVWELCVD